MSRKRITIEVKNTKAYDTYEKKNVDSRTDIDVSTDQYKQDCKDGRYICPICGVQLFLRKVNRVFYFYAKDGHKPGCKYNKSGVVSKIKVGDISFDMKKTLTYQDSETEPLKVISSSSAAKSSTNHNDVERFEVPDFTPRKSTDVLAFYEALKDRRSDEFVDGYRVGDILIDDEAILNAKNKPLNGVKIFSSKRIKYSKLPNEVQNYLRNHKELNYFYLVDSSADVNSSDTSKNLYVLVRFTTSRISEKFKNQIMRNEGWFYDSIIVLGNLKKVNKKYAGNINLYVTTINSKCYKFN